MTAFDRALQHTLGVEGEFSDHPSDSGGATRFGITERLARAYGYEGSMRELPPGLAKLIYRANFWVPLQLDEIALRSESLALELFDTAVNLGAPQAAKFLQRALNVLNQKGTQWPDMAVDGRLGPISLAALKEYHIRRGIEGMQILLRVLNALQGAFYVELAERREKDEDFIYGWFRTRVVF